MISSISFVKKKKKGSFWTLHFMSFPYLLSQWWSNLGFIWHHVFEDQGHGLKNDGSRSHHLLWSSLYLEVVKALSQSPQIFPEISHQANANQAQIQWFSTLLVLLACACSEPEIWVLYALLILLVWSNCGYWPSDLVISIFFFCTFIVSPMCASFQSRFHVKLPNSFSVLGIDGKQGYLVFSFLCQITA